MVILTDRSRIECYEKCPRKRFWLYEYKGRGLRREGLELDARIGTWVHNGIEHFVTSIGEAQNATECAVWAGWNLIGECKALGYTPEQEADVHESAQIVTALVYAWCKVRYPRLVADGEVLAVEKELSVDFPVGGDTVRLMTRPDIIWHRHSDDNVLIRNLKTVRRADTRWREKWALDMQTLSEVLAVDKWLADLSLQGVDVSDPMNWVGIVPDLCGGVIIDGLQTGELMLNKDTGRMQRMSPLITCWMKEGDAPLSQNEFYGRYEWTCTESHKYANGRKCCGGVTHRLSGAKRVSVADKYPGGVIAWVDHLIDTDLSLVEEQFVELPTIIRDEYSIERWKRQVLPREQHLRWNSDYVSGTHPDHASHDAVLDLAYSMHTAGGNCLYPSKCECYDLCHGSSAADPMAAGYTWRVPNHQEEREKVQQND